MAMASSDSPSGGSGDRDVFGSLPNARPQRRSARRDRSAAKAKPAAKGAAGAAAKPRATAKPAAGAKAKPAARAAAATTPTPAARAKPATPPRASAPQFPAAGYGTPRSDDDGVPRAADLVTTAGQAAGELAQIGLAAGSRALKSALERLPRP